MNATLPPGRVDSAPLPTPLPGEHGALPFRAVRYEALGAPENPAVIVLGGISATRHVAAHRDDPSPGWWEAQVGPGRAVDTDRFRVVGVDYLGAELGRGDDVPSIGTCDQARAVAAALDALGVGRAHAVVGASYGGMVALAFASLFPERTERIAVVAAAHEPHPMATAVRSVQRGIVRLGLASGRADEGLALARALAMTTYRTAEEMTSRFDPAPLPAEGRARFPVEAYLEHCGRRYVESFTPERFLALSESIDLHRVDPAAVRVPATLVAVEGDAVAPAWQLRDLASRLGAPAALHVIESIYGHDAFLKETDAVATLLTLALGREQPT